MDEPINPPARLGGFELGKAIGRGGMGVVYRARQVELDRWVALKILPPEFRKQPEFAERFRAEARAAAKLDHPNLVRVWEAGEADGQNFFAMELVEGMSCEKRIRELGEFSEEDTILIGLAVASALSYAWTEARLIHRDIKPDNILLRAKDGEIKLADLGLAKSVKEVADTSGLTQPGMVMGTFHYMSPEQAQGKSQVDFRADMYSLGATMYHLLTGHPPFHGENSFGLLVKQISTPFPDIREKRPELSEKLILILDKMVAKNRDDRYVSWDALVQDLDAILEGRMPPSFQASNLPQWASQNPSTASSRSNAPESEASSGSGLDPKILGWVGLGVLGFLGLAYFIVSGFSSGSNIPKHDPTEINISEIPPTPAAVDVDPGTPEWLEEFKKGSVVSLFNGKNFNGWNVGKGWQIILPATLQAVTADTQRHLDMNLLQDNFEMVWQMRLVGNASAGVDFRSVKGRLYTILLEPGDKNDQIKLQRWESDKNDFSATILAGPAQLRPGWHRLRLVTQGASVALECDETVSLHKENQPSFGQGLTLFARKGTAEFKEITIRALPAAAPPASL